MPLIKYVLLPFFWSVLPSKNLHTIRSHGILNHFYSHEDVSKYSLLDQSIVGLNHGLLRKEGLPLPFYLGHNKDRISFVAMQQASELQIEEEASSGDLKDLITYQAQDSISFDIAQKEFNIYGAGVIGYDEVKLTSENISLNWETGTIIATGKPNEQGQIDPKPVVEQGKSKYFAEEIRYNIQSKRGTARKLFTKLDEDIRVRAEKAKVDVEETYYADQLALTSCSLANPHYFIKASHVKYVQGKRIASGPFQFYFDGVPTILGFFYGLLYLPASKSSGIIPPKPGEDSAKGFYLKEGGYYFYFNDYIDLVLRGSVYSKGEMNFETRSNYKKRYGYHGHMEYERKVIPVEKEFQISQDKVREWIFKWQHQTDHSKVSRLTAEVDIQHRAGNYVTRHQDDANLQLKVQTNSRINYYRKLIGTPYSFTTELSHTENLSNKLMKMTLPQVILSSTPIYFLRWKNSTKKRWYQDIHFKHTLKFQYDITNEIIKDKPPFEHSRENWMKFLKEGVYGAEHHFPLAMNVKLFSYFNLKPFLEYTERWYGKRYKYEIKDGKIAQAEDVEKGFYRVWNYRMGTDLQTTIYGTHIFSDDATIKAIRHRIEPSLGFSYEPGRPDYWQSIQEPGKEEVFKDKFSKPPYGTPERKTKALLTMKVDNVLEMKIRDSDKEGATKKLPIFESLYMKTSYDFLADSFPLSDFQLGGRTKLFDGLVSLDYKTTLDPYTYHVGDRVEEFAWQNGQGFGNVKSYNLEIGTSFSSKNAYKKEPTFGKKKNKKQALDDHQDIASDNGGQLEALTIAEDPMNYVGVNLPWNVNLMYRQNYKHDWLKHKKETTRILEIGSVFNVTKNWKIELNTAFDLDKEELVGESTKVKIYRDLHCWEMSFDWFPLKKIQSFDFSIGLKASMLKDIKIPHSRSYKKL